MITIGREAVSVPTFAVANHFWAKADEVWLAMYWSGHKPNTCYTHTDMKPGYIYFAPTDSYQVVEGSIPHVVSGLRRFNSSNSVKRYERHAHDCLVGYRIQDVVSFTWFTQDWYGCIAQVTGTRLDKGRWEIEYFSGVNESPNHYGEHPLALTFYFMSCDPAELEIIKLDNPIGALHAANEACQLAPFGGGCPVGYDSRPHELIMNYCQEKNITIPQGNFSNRLLGNHPNERTPSPELVEVLG